MTETDICNLALGRIGGAGDQINGNALLDSIDGTDKVSSWCKTVFPVCRRRAIVDLAIQKCPFRESTKFRDLGSALDSESIPEIGQYEYAFNLPNDCLAVVCQLDENYMTTRHNISENYIGEVVSNKNGNGKIWLTNSLTNLDGTSAFIEYAVDVENTGVWSEALIECVAALLAAELCPIVGKDIETRKRQTIEYSFISVPFAKTYNQNQQQFYTKSGLDFTGGRNTGAHLTLTDKGTYVVSN